MKPGYTKTKGIQKRLIEEEEREKKKKEVRKKLAEMSKFINKIDL